MSYNAQIKAEEQISRMCTAARYFAILTVISAHITIRTSEILADLYSVIGSIGVIVFLIISGYYYKKESISVLIRKKMKTIIFPWLLLGSLVYITDSLLTGRGLSIVACIEWVVGYKTYLYFVTILVLCFVLFYYRNLYTMIFAIAINIVSIILTYLGMLNPFFTRLHMTAYLNVFNWIGFFALGLLLRRVNAEKIMLFIKKVRWLFLVLSVTIVIVVVFFKLKVGYFSAWGWMFELICALGIFSLCSFEWTYNKHIISVSRFSFAIYLSHMLTKIVVAKLYSIHPSITIFANLLVLEFTWFMLWLGELIASKIKLGKLYDVMLGIREKKINK